MHFPEISAFARALRKVWKAANGLIVRERASRRRTLRICKLPSGENSRVFSRGQKNRMSTKKKKRERERKRKKRRQKYNRREIFRLSCHSRNVSVVSIRSQPGRIQFLRASPKQKDNIFKRCCFRRPGETVREIYFPNIRVQLSGDVPRDFRRVVPRRANLVRRTNALKVHRRETSRTKTPGDRGIARATGRENFPEIVRLAARSRIFISTRVSCTLDES